MGILNIKKRNIPVVMTPSDVEVDVQLDAVTGEYRDVVRFIQKGQPDIILQFRHGAMANIARELEEAKKEYFP